MEYSKIIAVSGLPGLFELVSSKNDGAIVRSLDDKTTRFVASRVHNFSHLESIEIYTVRDNVNLVDILLAMQKNGGILPDTKDNAAVKKYFETAYPDLDFERVYASDMKKIIKWYEVLDKNKIEIKLSEPAPEEVEEAPEEEAPPAKEKPAAAKAPKAEKTAEAAVVEEEAPKKKAAPKKKETTEEEAEKPAKKAAAKAPKATKEEPAEEAPKKKAAAKKK